MANVDNSASVLEMREVQAAARTIGLEVATLEIRRGEDIAPAFEGLKGRVDALYVCVDTVLFSNRISVNTLALSARLPTIFLREVSCPMDQAFPTCSGALVAMSIRFCTGRSPGTLEKRIREALAGNRDRPKRFPSPLARASPARARS
jgi:ABC-type uncharacterized transport system substrate-binding protein